MVCDCVKTANCTEMLFGVVQGLVDPRYPALDGMPEKDILAECGGRRTTT